MKLLTYLIPFLMSTTLFADSIRLYLGTGGNGEAKGIYTTTLNRETGVLAPVVLATPASNCGFLTLDQEARFLYATGPNQVASFAVGADFLLTPVNTQNSGGQGPCMVSLDQTGKVLMVANYGSGSVAAYKINGEGQLAASESIHQHEGSSANPKRQSGPHAHSIYATPDNRFACAADLGTDEVIVYALDSQTASLRRVSAVKVPPGSGPRHMKFSPDGKTVYVVNEMACTVAVLHRDLATGALTLGQVIPVIPEDVDGEGMSCSEILIDPTGTRLYTANRDVTSQGRDSLSLLEIDPDGELTLHQTVDAAVKIPRHINLDPSGRWLLVAGQASNTVSVFQVGEAGRLRLVAAPLAVPKPMCILFVPGS